MFYQLPECSVSFQKVLKCSRTVFRFTFRDLRDNVSGDSSTQKYVQCGIPQGSCLGPLLFIMYVNDFERCLEHCTPNINMYAEDTSVTNLFCRRYGRILQRLAK